MSIQVNQYVKLWIWLLRNLDFLIIKFFALSYITKHRIVSPKLSALRCSVWAKQLIKRFFAKKRVLLDMPDPVPKVEKDIKEWSLTDVIEWLSESKLGNWTNLFEEHQIDGEDLLELTRERLAEFGVERGLDQARIMGAIEKLKASKEKS